MSWSFRVLLLKMAYWLKFLIARLTRAPIVGRILYNNIFKNDRLIYLPVDTYHWVVDFCICRRSGKCHSYPIDLGCIFLGEAATKISSHVGHRVTKKEALEHAKRCREAGLIHLIGRHKVDALWLNVGPGDRLLTICNCCPCCCGWRVLPDFAVEIGSKVTKMPGITVLVTNTCVGCGTCENVCFINAIGVVDSRAVISDQCRGCGHCADVCPQKAIEIVIDNACIEKSISHISEAVDVS